jgi:hypothetical protein
MSAAAAMPRTAAATKLSPQPLPSPAQLRLEQTPMHELEKIFVRGAQPSLDDLVGWEFRGVNHLPLNVLPVAQLVGIKKFVKGFYRTEHGTVMGYNSPVARNVLDGRWNVAPKRFGYYEVAPVDPTARDNQYLHAVLLDYGKGKNPGRRSTWPALDPSQVLRDYLVQVDSNNPDLFLGKAYVAVGPLRIATSFFILERFRVGLTDYVKR